MKPASISIGKGPGYIAFQMTSTPVFFLMKREGK